jgi:1-acyl-sn-glycerol-3-phosphate acyltransferase
VRPALFLATAIALLLRGGAVLRLTARFRPGRVMDFVSRFQPVISRKLFWAARVFGGLRTAVERARGPLPPTFLIVSNHQSLADIPALAMAFPRHGLRYVAKRELARGLPYISPSLRMGGHALISRTGSFREGQEAMKALAELGSHGICPVVFPEGTRSRDGRVKEFFTGAMRVMLERNPLPVLSVAVDGGYRLATVPRLITGTRGTTYRVKPLTLYPAPHGKREIQEIIARTEAEIRAQVEDWRAQESAARGAGSRA